MFLEEEEGGGEEEEEGMNALNLPMHTIYIVDLKMTPRSNPPNVFAAIKSNRITVGGWAEEV